MKCTIPLIAMLLASCAAPGPSPGPGASRLQGNTLACRNQQSVAALHASGHGFQRTADGELASGRCRVFQQGHKISGGGRDRFIDAQSGVTYFTYRPG